MRRRSARSAVLAVLVAFAAPAAPAAAQPADEIEMDPEPATPQAPAKPSDAAQPPARDAAAPADAAAPVPVPVPVKDPKAARKWLATGQQLLQKGDWSARARRADETKASYAGAVDAFEKSIAAGDDLNTYALLADAEEKLGKLELAARHYRVLVKAQAGVRPDVRKKATARFDELSTKIGILTLVVKPEGAAIMLAGKELGKAPLAEPLVLMPGTYTVSFQADGFQPREAELNIEAGAESERTFELEPVKIIVQAPPPPEPPPPPPPPPSRLPLYAGGGAAVALLGTAVITGILAVGQHGTYTSRDATSIERADAKANGQTLALVTDLALAGGLAAGGFTAYWYFVKYKSAQQRTEQRTEQRPATASGGRRDGAQSAKVDLIPWVQSDASGLTLVGVF